MPLATEITNPGWQPFFYLRIDGIPHYIFERLPGATWTPPTDVTFVEGLHRPPGFNISFDPIDCTTHHSSMTFEFHDWQVTTGADAGKYFFTNLFAEGRIGSDTAIAQTYVKETLTRTDTTFSMAATAAGADSAAFTAPGIAYVGNETVSYTGVSPLALTGVTRARFPAVDGAGLARRHEAHDGTAGNPDDQAQFPIISSVPYTWYHRMVALYLNYLDQYGNPGLESDSALLWVGYIHKKDFGVRRNTWRISCDHLMSAMLDNEILSDRPGRHTTLVGIEFTGTPVSSRQFSLRINDIAAERRWTDIAVTAQFYASADALLSELNTQIVANAPAGTEATVGFSRTEEGNVKLTVASSASENVFYLEMSRALAFALGYEGRVVTTFPDDLRYGRTVIFGHPDVTYTEIDDVIATQLPARVFWFDSCTQMRVHDPLDSTLWGGVQGDGARRAVMIDDRLPIRYGGVAASPHRLTSTSQRLGGSDETMVAPAHRPWPQPGYVLHREDEDGDVSVVQCYIPSGISSGSTVTDYSIYRHILRLLASTGEAVNGTDDVLPLDYGVGVPSALIDRQSFLDLEPYADPPVILRRFYAIAKPWALRELVEDEMKALAFTLVFSGGRITARPVGWSVAPTITLDESNKTDVRDRGSFEKSPAYVVNRVQLQHDHNWLEDEFRTTRVFNDLVSQKTYQKTRAFEFRNKGVHGGYLGTHLFMQAVQRVQQFRLTNPTIRRTIDKTLLTRILPSDEVLLTDDGLPDPFDGTRGFAARSMLLIDMSFDFSSGRMGGQVTLVFNGTTAQGRRSVVCPSGLVTTWVAGTLTLTIAAAEFSSPLLGDITYFSATDAVLIVEAEATDPTAPQSWARTVTSVNVAANSMVLSADLAGFDAAKTYYVTFGRFNVATASQTGSRGTWIADDGDMRVGDARPYHYAGSGGV